VDTTSRNAATATYVLGSLALTCHR
jgi:hypothetical protein